MTGDAPKKLPLPDLTNAIAFPESLTTQPPWGTSAVYYLEDGRFILVESRESSQQVTWNEITREVAESWAAQHGQSAYAPEVFARVFGKPIHAERLQFDLQTYTIILDNKPYKIDYPKAFLVYKAIADKGGATITKGRIRDVVLGVRGQKTIPKLLKTLPPKLRKTVEIGSTGYWLRLPAKTK
jgi:hypothetical protein